MSDLLLEASHISKRFGGIAALADVSVGVAPGETVGLIGPNGAGKTTLFDCILGVTTPDEGKVIFDHRDVTRLPVHKRARLGLARTFQRMELFTSMTVVEHLLVAANARPGPHRSLAGLLGMAGSFPTQTARAQEVMALLGLDDLADSPVDALSMGKGRLVELGRALMTDPRLLMLDEPSSGLDSAEAAGFVEVVRTVREERNLAVLIVEHDLAVVSSLCERLVVLDHGTLIADAPTSAVLSDPAVRAAYLGDAAVG
jgi:branched-chain amino acid transport system ATP-binding protein